ncbi:MAG: alpha/beta hydrolase, partial [Planctomycetota bacterium]
MKKPAGAAPDFADVSYGPHESNVLDLWLAKSDRPAPLLVFFHGGGFHSGDKKAVGGLKRLAKEG